MKRKNLTLLFLIASLCFFAVQQGYADTVKVCETKNSNTLGDPLFFLKSQGKDLTKPYKTPSPGACTNISTNTSSLIGKKIDVKLTPTMGVSSYHTIGTVVFSSPEDLKNCYISIYYSGTAYIFYKAKAELACTA